MIQANLKLFQELNPDLPTTIVAKDAVLTSQKKTIIMNRTFKLELYYIKFISDTIFRTPTSKFTCSQN